MRSKHKLAYIALSCMLLLSGVVLLVNVRAQATKQARVTFNSDRDGNWEVYVMDADGKNPRNLTNNPGDDLFPAWSPDGQRIVFTSLRDGNNEIYVMGAAGRNPYRLTNNPAFDICPVWSPDGQRIAFASLRDGNWEVYVMDADGKNPRNLTNNSAGDEHPDWFDPAYGVSPAGKLKARWGWLKQTSK